MASLSAFSRVQITPRVRSRARSVTFHPRLAVLCVPRASSRDDEDASKSPSAAAATPVRTTHSAFACPVCGGATTRAVYASGSTSLRCAAGHALDVAKEGHVNLLAAKGGGRKRVTGDTNEMVQARRRFLDAEHYADAAETIAEGVARYLSSHAHGSGEDASPSGIDASEEAKGVPSALDARELETTKKKPPSARARRIAANKRRDTRARADRRAASIERASVDRDKARDASRPLVVDFGCGEGYWLGKVAARVARERDPSRNVVAARFAGIDASPAAAKAAARRLRASGVGAEIAVGDAQRDLAFPDGSVDVALSVFAPRNVAELARVVKKGGVVVVASPGDAHLAELRALQREDATALGGLRVIDAAANKRDAVLERFTTRSDDAFELVAEIERAGVMRLTWDDVAALVGMGPSAFHQAETKTRVRATDDDAARGDGHPRTFEADGAGVVDVTRAFIIQTFRRKG